MDTELFELCKEVYKRTGWVLGTSAGFAPNGARYAREGKQSIDELPNGTVCPVYTSDYLLEKLPIHLGDPLGIAEYLRLEPLTKGKWAACYGNNKSFDEWSDTPLKALLKLTIALDDAGELSHE